MTDPTYYETMYILRPDIPEEEVESHSKKYRELLEKIDVQVLDSQMRGKRRLAYPISKHKEGVYVQLSHQGNGQQVAILEKAMRLSEDVIRYLTVKQEGPLPTPKTSSGEEDKKRNEESNTDDKSVAKSKDSENEKNINKEEKSNKDN
tara:strand:- start:1108 stop:1551 length:444 start_codon:yes stop_codon:yes gene_type:complete